MPDREVASTAHPAHRPPRRTRRQPSSRRPLLALVASVALLLSTFGLAIGPANADPTPPLRTVALLAAADPSFTVDVQNKLAASAAFESVTTLPESGCGSDTTPSLSTLQQYDEVYVWSDCQFGDQDALGDVLADYVDDGGHVVVSAFASLSGVTIGGRFASGGYLPTTVGDFAGYGDQSLIPDVPTDPLLAGVTSFDGGSSSYHGTNLSLTAGATMVAHWTDGSPLVAYLGNVVELNFYPPSSDARADFWTSTTDGVQLMVNALNGAKRATTAPTIASADHETFSAGVDGSFTVTASGVPTAAITETGALPDGVTFTDNLDGTATLAGTPAAETGGSYPLTLSATNGTDPDASQDFTLTVNEAPTITSVDAAAFTVGAAGSFVVTTTAGYPTATVLTETGTLPDGLEFTDNGDGTAAVSGSPADGSAGSYPITVAATNAAGAPSTQTLTLTVSLAPQTVAFTSASPSPAAVVGQTYLAAAIGGGSTSPVVVTVDEASTAVCTITGATVTFVHPGTCVLDADQAGDGHYAAASSSQTIAVTSAATSTTVSVQSSGLSATVIPAAPGAGVPTGTVAFSVDGTTVGTATLVKGTATLTYQVAAGQTRSVAAVYAGNTDFSGSSDSTARHDPTITATVSSSKPRSSHGWYRTPVTVTFHCTTDGAALITSCPAPVTLQRSGAGQSVTRSVQAKDGGAAMLTVRGINIDLGAPRVAVAGVANRATYPGQAPTARCASSDALSGVARCTLSRHVSGESVTVTATATDRAGNVSRASVRYTVARFYIAGVAYRNGAYQVREGHNYVVVALTTGSARPRYYNAAPHGKTPAAPASYFARSGKQSGLHRYTLLIRIDRGLGRYLLWDMGVKTGGTLHRITFRPNK